MQTITLEIPDSIASDLEILDSDFIIQILKKGIKQYKIEKALERYRNSQVPPPEVVACNCCT